WRRWWRTDVVRSPISSLSNSASTASRRKTKRPDALDVSITSLSEIRAAPLWSIQSLCHLQGVPGGPDESAQAHAYERAAPPAGLGDGGLNTGAALDGPARQPLVGMDGDEGMAVESAPFLDALALGGEARTLVALGGGRNADVGDDVHGVALLRWR